MEAAIRLEAITNKKLLDATSYLLNTELFAFVEQLCALLLSQGPLRSARRGLCRASAHLGVAQTVVARK